ncbi:FtsK/SpoIIIE domain-containing protein [Bacillus sp. 166amftsu]|uniref:FtsK/SpoIIIE domain-containing protein n=1 Tax=Bacillus sp. 166amftsu TaxID=1761753 RepID=UPI00089B1D6A|nr:FtsK/SpoIIIE domain-containing protein [Bacillus sp. 166amftsu]SDZ39005.1 DNA segregation ATPase FtsK/SpoIIIE, S-DNA-T family [Bacillus sp. 166amftsu]
MLELLTIPAVMFTTAILYKNYKQSDKKKIARFFEIANICVKEKNKLEYPRFKRQEERAASIMYIYELPLGIPSQLIKKLDEVIAEGLNKPVKIHYVSPFLYVQVFEEDIPKIWEWSENLIRPGTWKVAIGKTLDKTLYHDFDQTPHLLMGGLTRMGKTVFLKVLVTTLIKSNPNHTHFFIIDLKEEGLEFTEYQDLKQVIDVADSPKKAHEVLVKVMALMHQRGKFMKKNRMKNIVQTKEKDRFFVIVDEGAVLAPAKGLPKNVNRMLEECQYMLSHISRIGGALGVRLILATQYPTVTSVPSVVKQMSDAKLGFRLPTTVASQVVLDEPGLEDLPSLPGRALFKNDRIHELQVPYLSDEMMRQLLREYEVIKHHEAPEAQTESQTDRDFIQFK